MFSPKSRKVEQQGLKIVAVHAATNPRIVKE